MLISGSACYEDRRSFTSTRGFQAAATGRPVRVEEL